MHPVRRAALQLTVLLAALAFAPVAPASTATPLTPLTPRALNLVPQVSIRGVMLGMTPDQVVAKLGKPDESLQRKHPILGKTRILRFGLLKVVFDGVTATSAAVTMTTTSRRERTAAGVGVGSRETVVRQRVAGVKCLKEYGYRHCFVGIQKAGRVVTDFSLSTARRVTRISLSRVID